MNNVIFGGLEMKFNPECDKKTLIIWLRNTDTGCSYYDFREDGLLVDGWITPEQAKMIHDWNEAHKND